MTIEFLTKPAQYYGYLRWAFVRNPYERLLSAYHWLNAANRNDTPAEYLEQIKGKSFRAWARWVADGNQQKVLHTKPMCDFVCVNGKLAIDYVGRFESLHQDWWVLCSRLGFPRELPFVAKTNHKSWKSEYDKPLLRQVQEAYAMDFEMFNY